ncbi:MAG: alpha/beta fold hydrolase [Syntrophobacter sp.]
MRDCRAFRIELNGVNLSAAVHLPLDVPAPVIICSHGLLSSKDSSKYLAIGEHMSNLGFCVLRFDFSGCGQSAARRETLVGARMRDLNAVLTFARTQPWSDGHIGLLGSSLGGFLSLLAANENPDIVNATVSWVAPFDISHLDPAGSGMDELKRLIPGGFELGEPRDLGDLRNVRNALLIHGREDEVVPWTHSIEIYKRIGDPKDLILMRDADHQLTDESWRAVAIRATLDWFARFF